MFLRGPSGGLLKTEDGKLANNVNCCCGNCVETCQVETLDVTVPEMTLCEVDVSGVYSLDLTDSTVDGTCRTCTYGGVVDGGVFIEFSITYCSDTGNILVNATVYPEGNAACYWKWVKEFTCAEWCVAVNAGTFVVEDTNSEPKGDLTIDLDGECCCEEINCPCCLPYRYDNECLELCATSDPPGPDLRLDVDIPGRLTFTDVPIDAEHFIPGESCISITCGDNELNIGEWIDDVSNPYAIGATWTSIAPACDTDGEYRNWTIYFAVRCQLDGFGVPNGTLELKFIMQTDSVCFYYLNGVESDTVWHDAGFSILKTKCWGTSEEVDITFTFPLSKSSTSCVDCPDPLSVTLRLRTP